MSAKEVVLYDPTAEPRILAAGLAPRLSSLRGKKVAILDNSKANAGFLMLTVARRLQEQYGVGEIVKREKGIPSVVLGTFEFEQLAKLEAKNRGMADLPLALIPHPLGGIREDEVLKKAELVIDLVVKAVTLQGVSA